MLLQDHVFTLETSTPNAGRKISASFTRNGVVYENAGAVATPTTGAYDAFTSRNVAVVLEAGVQVLRLTFGGGNDQDLRSFSIAPVVGGATSAQSLAGGDAVLAFSLLVSGTDADVSDDIAEQFASDPLSDLNELVGSRIIWKGALNGVRSSDPASRPTFHEVMFGASDGYDLSGVGGASDLDLEMRESLGWIPSVAWQGANGDVADVPAPALFADDVANSQLSHLLVNDPALLLGI